MLNKVRARHGIELPVEKWRKTPGLAIVLGGLVLLFIAIPLGLALVKAITGGYATIAAIGIVSGVVVLFGAGLFRR